MNGVTDELLNEVQSGEAELITLAAAGELPIFRLGGKPTQLSTMHRLCQRGFSMPDGSIIKLEHIRRGRRVVTTKRAAERFVRRCSGIDAPPSAPTTAAKEQQKRDMRTLKEAGIAK